MRWMEPVRARHGRGGRSATESVAALRGEDDGAQPRIHDVGRALGELELLQKLNRAIIANLPSGIAVVDDHGRLVYYNASFEQMWQARAGDLGRPLRAVSAGGPLSEVDWAAEVRRLHSSGRPLPDNVIETGSWPARRVIRYGLFP